MAEFSGLQQEDQANKLALQVKYLNDLLDNINELFYTYDVNGIVTFINKKSHDILGYQQHEIIGNYVWDFVHPSNKENLVNEVKRRLKKGKRNIYLSKILHKSGDTRILRINVAPIMEDGRIIGEVCLAEDVTNARRNEKALKDSNLILEQTKNELLKANRSLLRAEEELRKQLTEAEQNKEALANAHSQLENIMDFLPDPTFVIDKQGKVKMWNKAIEVLTGVKARNILGRDNREYSVIFYGNRRPMLIDLAAELADINAEKNHYNMFKLSKDCLYADQFVQQIGVDGMHVSARAAPLFDDTGSIYGAIETVRDLSERIKSINELKESEEKYRNIIESIEDGYFEVDKYGEFTFVNSYLHRAIGYDYQEIIGNSFQKLMDEENTKKIKSAFASVYDTGEPLRAFDWSVYKKDGSCMFVETTILPVKENDKVNGFRGLVRDITARKKTEQALQDSEQRLRGRVAYLDALIANLNELFVTYDPDGKITFVNKKVDDLIGYTMEEVIGRHVNDFVPQEYHDKVNNDIGQRTKEGRAATYELPIIHKNDSERIIKINSTPIRNEREEIKGGMILAEDITSTKIAQKELAMSEKRYRGIVQDQTELICRFLQDLTLTFTNDAYCRFFNLQGQESTGKIPDYMIFANERGMFEKKLKGLTPEKSVITIEHKLKFPDGREFWLQWTCRAIFDENEILIEYQAVGRDISERKLAEEQLIYMSTHDALTDLFNRLYFEKQMQLMQNNDCLHVGVIVCDVDGLKLVNDTLGHTQGDNTLQQAATIIQSCFRRQDVIARVGGDEFAVLLPSADWEIINQAFDRIRNKINKYNLSADIPLSISIGAAIRANPIITMSDVFKEADNNMYREKLHSHHSARSAIVQTLTRALKERDYITEGHAERMQDLLERIARKLGMGERTVNDLRLFAQFHDIGKVGVPDAILFKTGPLTKEEYLIMQRHCEIGHRIALSSPEMTVISDWILKHHEWWNGKGYPLGLKGEEIPLECRILAIADAYDAMTSVRPYRKALTHMEAVEELKKYAGLQFDPALVDVFLTLDIETSHMESDNAR